MFHAFLYSKTLYVLPLTLESNIITEEIAIISKVYILISGVVSWPDRKWVGLCVYHPLINV